MASIYMISKISAHPKSPRSVINVFAYLTVCSLSPDKDNVPAPDDYYVTEEEYHERRNRLVKNETTILRTLGFQLHVSLPHAPCINFLQTLDVFQDASGSRLANLAFAQLNALLLSPQLVYLTHQPAALATAAIYLSAKELAFKLPEDEWWEVFDTDREDLGFLVVAMTSMNCFAAQEKLKWQNAKVPSTVKAIERETQRQDR